MLSGNNDEKLVRKHVDAKVVPFYQVWQELVRAQTLDVYQYRVLTSFSALKELLAVIEKTQQGLFTTDDNIEACRLETLYIVKQDKVLEKYNKSLLNRLQAALGKKPTSTAEKNRLSYHLKYAIGILNPVYMEWVLIELKASVVDSNISDIEYFADLAVICAPEKLHEQYCFGAPTVVMEILSPSTAKADRFVKLNRYQQAGVPEYWIISPQEQNATVFVLENGLYRTVAVYTKEDSAAKVFTLTGCELDLTKVFE